MKGVCPFKGIPGAARLSTGDGGPKGAPTQRCHGQGADPPGCGGFGGASKAPNPELTPLPTLLPQVSVE